MPSSNEPEDRNPSAGQSTWCLRARIWTGRALSALATLFLLFDAIGKVTMPPPVMAAFVRLGFPTRLSSTIAILLFACTILYAIPKTSVFGAVLLTGYLGGAVAIQMRSGSPLFETVFPVIFGAVVWAGILLRESRLGELIPVRSSRGKTLAELLANQNMRSGFDAHS
jgi:DoxX-like protein